MFFFIFVGAVQGTSVLHTYRHSLKRRHARTCRRECKPRCSPGLPTAPLPEALGPGLWGRRQGTWRLEMAHMARVPQWETHGSLHLLVATSKTVKQTGSVHFKSIFYLTSHIQALSFQRTILSSLSPQNLSVFYTHSTSLLGMATSHARDSHVAGGCCTGQDGRVTTITIQRFSLGTKITTLPTPNPISFHSQSQQLTPFSTQGQRGVGEESLHGPRSPFS